MTRELKQRVNTTENTVQQLVELLIQNAARELSMYYYYSILCVCLHHLEGEDIREIVEAARNKNRKNFEALVERIHELGGKLPFCMKEMYDVSPLQLTLFPVDLQNVQEVLQMIIEAERRIVRSYTQICNMAAGRDHATFILVQEILNEELEHKAWFSEFLEESPLNHFMIQRDSMP